MTATHHAILAALAMVIGSCVGSFLNVCAYRIPQGLSPVRPASHCPGCRSAVRPRDNLPILGWLILGGRCRDCRMPISPRYPLVELIVGLLFAGAYAVRVAAPGGDILDEVGVGYMLLRLVADGLLASLLVLAWLIGRDAGARSA
jgi:prepilin signal peptidase PulO-like enzyme (type II secretory pathway)